MRAVAITHPKRVARTVWGCAFVMLIAGAVIDPRQIGDIVFLVAIALPFATVGALLASHRPANPIGWLFLAFGLVAAIDFAATQYAHQAVLTNPGSLPGGDVAASISAHIWHASFGFFVFSFLLFPNGRLLSPRWRWFAVAVVVDYAGLALSGIFDAEYLREDIPYAHPLFSGVLADVGSGVFAVLQLSNLLILPTAGVSLLLRLKRSRGVERQQLKWFVNGVAFVMFAFPLGIAVVGDGRFSVLLLPLIPITAGVAIFKYRLYDIDVVINRALVYGALTATLAGTYLCSVLILQLVLSGLTANNGLAVAGSTLAVAALFQPGRHRIQAAVDRRFYRRKYDAARTLERFGANLREGVDLDALGSELRGVVAQTMQPAHVSLWMRTP